MPDDARFGRDRDHLRTCAFLGVVKECNGVFWWWFGKDSKWYYSASQNLDAWRDLSAVVQELAAIRSVIVAEGDTATGEDGNGIAWWRKTLPDGGTTTIRVDVGRHVVDVCEQAAK